MYQKDTIKARCFTFEFFYDLRPRCMHRNRSASHKRPFLQKVKQLRADFG
jgi:hypothetical protein